MRSSLIVIGWFVAFAMNAAAADEATFSLRETDPHSGTRINRRTVESGRLPFNRAYADLTVEQKEIVRNWYEGLAPDDEPPYPRSGLGPIYQRIGDAQRTLQAKGSARLDVEIDSKGVAQSVKVYESPDPNVTKLVAAVLMQADYKPGRCAGLPCRMWMPFQINFKFE